MTYSLLQQAEAFIQTGELADALAALNAHLASAPADDPARRLRAALRLRLAGSDHLRAALDDLAALAAPSADDDLLKSVILQRLGDLAGAAAAAQAACDRQPDDERAAERLFSLLLALADFDRARALLAAQPPTWQWAQAAGDLHAAADHPAAAVAAYSEALARLSQSGIAPLWANPIAARLLLARASSHERAGALAAAAADMDAAARLMPADPTIAAQRERLRGA